MPSVTTAAPTAIEAPSIDLRWRTLADIADDPPADLLLDMLEPDGPNLLHAAGGTGKGSTGAYLVRELQAVGMKSLIYDPEGRPKE